MTFKNEVQNNNFIAMEVKKVKKSVVDVYFSDRNLKCTYFNDQFDLKLGDVVYVEGKLEGKQGRVVDINYNFKIKLSDYMRVVGVVDTFVSGEFYQAGSHFITTDKSALNYEKALAWFKAPESDEEYVYSTDNKSFNLFNIDGLKIKPETANRGYEYYTDNRIEYIELNAGRGRAIVKGSKIYEVEFNYNGEEISNLVCSCYCMGVCKHQLATMLQLREILNTLKEEYPDVNPDNYLAAIRKVTFFEYAVDGKKSGKLIMR